MMFSTVGKLLFLLSFSFSFSSGTIDINLAEYQYLADHLTEKECHELVSALHFRSFELPKDVNAAERRLPEDVSCIDLLIHWNSTPREGKGQTHVEVCHRLNQIGREDLAQWLSKTVFHELSKDLKVSLAAETEDTTISIPNVTEMLVNEELDEAAWWKIDSFLDALVGLGLITLIVGIILTCILYCSRQFKSSKNEYTKLSTDEKD